MIDIFKDRAGMSKELFKNMPAEIRIRLVMKWPDLIDEVNLEDIPLDGWREVLTEHSEYLSKAPWDKFHADTKVYILTRNANASIFIDWNSLDEIAWNELLSARPEYYQFKP